MPWDARRALVRGGLRPRVVPHGSRGVCAFARRGDARLGYPNRASVRPISPRIRPTPTLAGTEVPCKFWDLTTGADSHLATELQPRLDPSRAWLARATAAHAFRSRAPVLSAR